MSQTDPSFPRVLAAYLAPQLQNARVLYVGDLDDAEPLFEAGARLVHVYRHTASTRQLPGPVLVQQLDRGLDLPTGGFDLAVVAELERITGRDELLASLRAALGSRGVGAVVARLGENVEYTELYDTCSTHFEHVKLVGKVPFTGTLLCELGLEGEPEVSVDTELAVLEAPTTLVALVSQRPLTSDEYAIFAHPPAPTPAPAPPPAPAPVKALPDPELSRLTLQNQVLEAQLLEARESRAQATSLTRDLEHAMAATQTARQEAVDLRNALAAAIAQQKELGAEDEELEKTLSELAVQSERAEESEARAAKSEARASAVQAHATQIAERAAKNEERVAALEARLHEQEERAAQLERRAVEGEQRAASAATELTRERQRASNLEASAQQAAARAEELAERLGALEVTRAAAPDDHFLEHELVSLETALRERGVQILELQAELGRRQRMVTQLLLAERFSDQTGAAVDLERKLDVMAKDGARRQSELEARGWRIQELESALAERGKTPDSLL